ncbi:hypothetical protein [Qipengyuania sp. JC766]|uniref:hypothetical protein n=1 Tax=Qipengyuania sp. JC766 TaxID=3232139 RepID=UPI003457F131
MNRFVPVLALAAALLSGCAGSSADYPSLAIRDFERNPERFRPPDPEPLPQPAPLSAATRARLGPLVAQAQEEHRGFMAAVARTQRAVNGARGAPIGTEPWGDAQVALADLDSFRSRTSVPLGDLDRLYADTLAEYEEVTAVAAARNQVIGLVAEQDAILARMRAAVR